MAVKRTERKERSMADVFERYKFDNSIRLKSKTWFQQQALLLARKRINPKKAFNEQRVTSKIVPGKLYMFFYDPKLKDKLPYYDRFPLVFPYKKTENGFMGLNLHYLPYYQRVMLLDKLMQFASNKNYDENTKIKYSWEMIAGVAKFKLANGCIKQYLDDHVDSMFSEVHPEDWHTALMLPVEQFVGANKSLVWQDSIKK